jgi:hypothetical protein
MERCKLSRNLLTEMDKISPNQAYYIKLGAGGNHEYQCIEVDQTIRVGFINVDHQLCVEKRWEEVKDVLQEKHNWNSSTASNQRNQLQAFYESGDDVLWITFYKNFLWWCYAEPQLTVLPNNSRTRPAKGGWKNTDINGVPLETRRLSGSLLSVQGYRATLCNVREFEYLVRKINSETSPEEQAAQQAKDSYVKAVTNLIQQLTWKDFELLVDLIFRQAGWQRISQLGKTQKSLDLDLLSPIRNERYLVQVKSRASNAIFEKFQERTSVLDEYACYFMTVHTPSKNLTKELETETHKLWLPDDIARLSIQYGLAEWVIEKVK